LNIEASMEKLNGASVGTSQLLLQAQFLLCFGVLPLATLFEVFQLKRYTGGFFNLLNPYSLLGGIVTLTVFLTHGAIFLSLKTAGEIRKKSRALATRYGLVAAVAAVAYLVWTIISLPEKKTIVLVLSALVAIFWLTALGMNLRGREGWAFIFSSLAIVSFVSDLFYALYPRVMPSSISSKFDLTITNASSTEYTLKVMTVVAVIMTPLVLIYQGWTYWVFRKRVSASQIAHPERGVLDGDKLPL
jgi:cytochrome d ubiquinol oxidase subunit II